MNRIFELILDLIDRKEILISDHGYDELAEDDILVREVLVGVSAAVMVEDYPDYPKGPCILVLQKDSQGKPIHGSVGHSKRRSITRCSRHSV